MNIVVFQHLVVEHPGVLREFWREKGYRAHVVELDEGDQIPDDLKSFDLMVVMGGPQDVWQTDLHPWLSPEIAAIRKWVVELRRPYLGICLGHQLLAAALGGEVGLMATPEVGLTTVDLTPDGRCDALLSGMGPTMHTLQWHGAEVSRLPAGAVVLAANAACPVQAIRWGRHAYGFQYHIEITERTVPEWVQVPEYKVSLERALGVDALAPFEQAVRTELHNFRDTARELDFKLTGLVHTAKPDLADGLLQMASRKIPE